MEKEIVTENTQVYWIPHSKGIWWPAIKTATESIYVLLGLNKSIKDERNDPIPYSDCKFNSSSIPLSLRVDFYNAVASANNLIKNNELDYKSPSPSKKREDYIKWDEYFMGLACLSAKRSKDPNTQVGACIVNSDNQIVGIGYNGFPRGCSDDDLPWAREGKELDTKYMYVCHAEMNAILNINTGNAKGCKSSNKMYVSLFPCNNCCKMIIQCGITEVIYLGDKYHDSNMSIASRRMFDMAEVKYTLYKGRRDDILIELN